MKTLSLEDVIVINAELHHGMPQVRDLGLLESAVARPLATVFGEDAYPTMMEKAAALLHSLARNHPFVDGNKRTATIATIYFLEKNGFRIAWNPDEAIQFILGVAQGHYDVPEIASWLIDNAEAISAD